MDSKSDKNIGEKAQSSVEKILTKFPIPTFEPVFLLTFSIYLLILISRLADTYLTDRGNEYLMVILFQIMIFVIPSLIYIGFKGRKTLSRLRLVPPRLDHTVLIIASTVMLLCGCLLLGMLCNSFDTSSDSFTLYNTFISKNDGTAAGVVYLILAYALLPAACEEFVFRGIVCSEFESRSGMVCTVLISSVLFTLLHFNPLQIPVYLFAGAVLCMVMYATRSVFGSFAVHFIYNICCVFMQSSFVGFYRTSASPSLLVTVLIAVFLLATAIAFVEAGRIYKSYAKKNMDSGYRVAPVHISGIPGTLFRSLYSWFFLGGLLIYLVGAIIF